MFQISTPEIGGGRWRTSGHLFLQRGGRTKPDRRWAAPVIQVEKASLVILVETAVPVMQVETAFTGHPGRDSCTGHPGRDSFTGHLGRDSCTGHPGRDSFTGQGAVGGRIFWRNSRWISIVKMKNHYWITPLYCSKLIKRFATHLPFKLHL